MAASGEPARLSVSEGGNITAVPNNPTSIVVESKNGEKHGLLEHWGEATWIYADADSLKQL